MWVSTSQVCTQVDICIKTNNLRHGNSIYECFMEFLVKKFFPKNCILPSKTQGDSLCDLHQIIKFDDDATKTNASLWSPKPK